MLINQIYVLFNLFYKPPSLLNLPIKNTLDGAEYTLDMFIFFLICILVFKNKRRKSGGDLRDSRITQKKKKKTKKSTLMKS